MSPSGASVLTKPSFPILQQGRLRLQPTALTREESQEAVLLEGRGCLCVHPDICTNTFRAQSLT